MVHIIDGSNGNHFKEFINSYSDGIINKFGSMIEETIVIKSLTKTELLNEFNLGPLSTIEFLDTPFLVNEQTNVVYKDLETSFILNDKDEQALLLHEFGHLYWKAKNNDYLLAEKEYNKSFLQEKDCLKEEIVADLFAASIIGNHVMSQALNRLKEQDNKNSMDYEVRLKYLV